MKRNQALALIALLAASVGRADAEAGACPNVQAVETEAQATYIESWADLYRSFLRFGQCDEGVIAAGFSNAVGTMLAHRWNELARLQSFTNINPKFESFVLRHIDDSVSPKDVDLILKGATTACPTGAQRLCAKIEAAASKEVVIPKSQPIARPVRR